MGGLQDDHPIEKLLAEHSALPALDTLVELGCDKGVLIPLLHLIRDRWPHLDDWKLLTGRDLKHLASAIRDIEHCATLIKSLNKSSFGFLLIVEGIREFRNLPNLLLAYARQLELAKATLGPKRGLALHMQKYWIVKYVISATRKPCDNEVSALIAATSGNNSYDTASHKQWRHKWFRRLDERSPT